MSDLTELTDGIGQTILINLDCVEGIEDTAKGAMIWFRWRKHGVEVRESRTAVLERWTTNRLDERRARWGR